MFAMRIAERVGAPSEKPPGFGANAPGFSENAPGFGENPSGSDGKAPRFAANSSAFSVKSTAFSTKPAGFAAKPACFSGFHLSIDISVETNPQTNQPRDETAEMGHARLPITDLGSYVNIVAGGDPVIVDASGFPSYSTTRVPDLSAPAAPTDLRLRQGDLSGSAIARYQAARSNSMNQVRSCIGDPNVEANWKDAGMFSGGKATISAIAPAQTSGSASAPQG